MPSPLCLVLYVLRAFFFVSLSFAPCPLSALHHFTRCERCKFQAECVFLLPRFFPLQRSFQFGNVGQT